MYGKKLHCTIKGYIVRCFCLPPPGVTCACSSFLQVETMVSLPLLFESSCVKRNENITISGCWVVQYREYWTEEKLYWTRRTAVSSSNIRCIGLLTIHYSYNITLRYKTSIQISQAMPVTVFLNTLHPHPSQSYFATECYSQY